MSHSASSRDIVLLGGATLDVTSFVTSLVARRGSRTSFHCIYENATSTAWYRGQQKLPTHSNK